MYKRGYEPAIRKIEDGPVFRYRTTHQQRVARKRRLQIQYETHFIRLRALSKVKLQGPDHMVRRGFFACDVSVSPGSS